MDKGQRMQAIAITAFGGPDRLTLMDLPVPPCGPDQVLIKIQAAGVGMWDVKVRQGSVRLEGQQFPLVLGWESAGTIEQVVLPWDMVDKSIKPLRTSFKPVFSSVGSPESHLILK
jgi:NADPH:quinone reductase-like Zn-dependent oxidoreductase